MMDVITSCVLQVFQKHVSNVSFVFRRTLQLLHLDVSKLDRVLHISLLSFLLSRLCVRRRNAEAVPTSVGGPHMLADRRNRRDVGEQARDGGISGRPDARSVVSSSFFLGKFAHTLCTNVQLAVGHLQLENWPSTIMKLRFFAVTHCGHYFIHFS